MHTQRSSSKSGLFLMELILAIVFFAMASAICIQLFAKSYVLSNASADLSMAVASAQSAAESFQAYPHNAKSLTDLGGITIGYQYDADWQPVLDGVQGAYRVTLSYTAENSNLLTANIAVYTAQSSSKQTPIFEITTKKYIGQ